MKERKNNPVAKPSPVVPMLQLQFRQPRQPPKAKKGSSNNLLPIMEVSEGNEQ